MDYEGQICRGPMERSSFKLPIAVGCSYNACKFCTLFKHLKYRELPIEQIEAELIRVSQLKGCPSAIFLGDGNAFGTGMDRFRSILELIHRYVPNCKEINMDATVTNIKEKTDKELKELHSSGVTHLYLGIESGLDDVLTFMNKDHDLKEAYIQIDRIKNAGLIFDAHIMTGVAGKGRGIENAEYLAKFLNNTKPQRVINFSMFLHKSAPLYNSIIKQQFVPAEEGEHLIEEKRLIELLQAQYLKYDGFHDFIEFRVKGILPKDRDKMLHKLEQKIVEYEAAREYNVAIVE